MEKENRKGLIYEFPMGVAVLKGGHSLQRYLLMLLYCMSYCIVNTKMKCIQKYTPISDSVRLYVIKPPAFKQAARFLHSDQ